MDTIIELQAHLAETKGTLENRINSLTPEICQLRRRAETYAKEVALLESECDKMQAAMDCIATMIERSLGT